MGPALQNAALPGGGQGRPPLQNPIGKRCVGAGGCPPSCQPIPGHCRVRQSRYFLETASFLLPLAALRRFPRRPELGLYRIPCNVSLRGRAQRPWQSVPPSPTEGLPIAVRRGRPPGRPVSGLVQILTLSVGADASVRPPDLHCTSCKSNVIAKPVRTLAVAIRPQSLPCLKGGGPAAGWWRDSCGEESPSHGFAVLRQGGHQPLRRFAHLPLHRGGFLFPCSAYPRQFAKG